MKKLMSSTVLVVSLVMLSFMFFAPAAHAARAAQPSPADVPDIQCLDVSLSNVSGQDTVTLKSPPGGGVHYTLTLYVTSECPKNHRVSNITIVGTATGTCLRGEMGSATVKFDKYKYAIYPNAGFGEPMGLTDFCATTEKGKVVATVPTTITMTVTATGNYIDGQAGQIATSNKKEILVWPA